MFGLLPLLPKPYDYLFFLDFLRFQVQHMFQNLFFFFFYFKKSYTVISLSPQIRCLFFLWNLFKFYDSFFSFFFCFFFFVFSFVLFFCGGKMIKVSVYLISNFYLIFHVMFLVAFDCLNIICQSGFFYILELFLSYLFSLIVENVIVYSS